MSDATRRHFASRLALTLGGASMAGASVAGATDDPAPLTAAGHLRVVCQMSDDALGKWQLALNNLRNLQSDLGRDQVELLLVAFGPGIGMVEADTPVAARLTEAMANGVRAVACQNTMRAQHLGPADMLRGVGFVPSGVVEVVRLQSLGWSYLRP